MVKVLQGIAILIGTILVMAVALIFSTASNSIHRR